MHSRLDIIEKAVSEHKKGNLEKSEDLYRKAISIFPRNTKLYYLIGTNLVKQNKNDEAIFFLNQGLRLSPKDIEILDALGVALLKKGESGDGIEKLRKALELEPNNPKTLFNIGKAYLEISNYTNAETYFVRLIKIQPNNFKIINNYAIALINNNKDKIAIQLIKDKINKLGPNEDAYKLLIEALINLELFQDSLNFSILGNKKWPKNNEILLFLATSYHKLKNRTEAKEEYLKLLKRDKNNHSYLNKYANFLYEIGQWKEAEEWALKLLKLDPSSVVALTNLGRIRQQRGDLELALKFYHKAIQENPDYADAHNNLGNLYLYIDKVNESIKYFDQAIKLKPKNMGFKFNRSLAKLTLGEIGDSWRDHKLRFKKKNPNPSKDWECKEWNGEKLINKKIILWGEQGLGDEIIHARCIKKVSEISKKCIVETSPRLKELFQRSFPKASIIGMQDHPSQKIKDKSFDFHASFLDINCYFYNSPEDINSSKYLKADLKKTVKLRKKYIKLSNGRPLIGISWSSSNTTHAHFKSTNLIIWKKIIENKKFQFINLQYGDTKDELKSFEAETNLKIITDKNINPSGDLDDFAAQVAAMDLVITISNTTAHMAGALGVPIWNILPTGPGRLWYWFLSGKTSPWYKSMRLFRHNYNEGWQNVIDEICTLLNKDLSVMEQSAKKRNSDLE